MYYALIYKPFDSLLLSAGCQKACNITGRKTVLFIYDRWVINWAVWKQNNPRVPFGIIVIVLKGVFSVSFMFLMSSRNTLSKSRNSWSVGIRLYCHAQKIKCMSYANRAIFVHVKLRLFKASQNLQVKKVIINNFYIISENETLSIMLMKLSCYLNFS